MHKTVDQIKQELNAKIPKEAITKREGGRGIKLDYLEGHYVINRMNEIFGPEGWSYEVTELRPVHVGEIKNSRGDVVNSASYVATVALYTQFDTTSSAKRIVDVGFGNGTDKLDPGKAHELATKEAVTDGIKRCAKSLGWSMGLALYDKSRENVEDAPSPVQETKQPVQEVKINRSLVNEKIRSKALVLVSKGKFSKESFQEMRKTKYGVDTTENLSDNQAQELLTYLEEQLNA